MPVAVIGGGITGLTAAWRLAREGHPVRLFEASPRPGGLIRSERDGEWLSEAGPNSLLDNKPELAALLAELGLEDARQYAQPAAKKRFIVRRGRPLAAPSSPVSAVTTPLLSLRGKLRIFGDLFWRPRPRAEDLPLGEFAAAHFGRELADYAVDPFVSGIYAGDPQRLSARYAFPLLWELEQKHGSLIRGGIAAAKARRATRPAGPAEKPRPPRARIFSFAEGLETIPAALAERLPAGCVETGARVVRLVPPVARGGAWEVVWERKDEKDEKGASGVEGRLTERVAAVILALPGEALARLEIGANGEHPLAALAEVEYPPVASLFIGYRREQARHPLDGFGMLAPSKENRNLLGVLFSSTLFPGRAPAGHIALTVLAGGVRRPELARMELPSLMGIVRAELLELLGVSGDPVYVKHRVTPHAIPQYNLGYGRFHTVIETAETAHPGLLVGGPVRDGIAVSACVAAGEKLARRVVA
ncbi:protoporphyrinogen oxidase [Opitutaceae bacterium TAV1]|nr:protoporphyrinogen oxidase [Opitutaceae bacterium TAV1]